MDSLTISTCQAPNMDFLTRDLASYISERLSISVKTELDIPWQALECEVAETRKAVVAKTESRSLLGTLTDFTHLLQWLLPDQSGLDLVQAAVELSHTPVQPLGRLGFPDKVTRELLA